MNKKNLPCDSKRNKSGAIDIKVVVKDKNFLSWSCWSKKVSSSSDSLYSIGCTISLHWLSCINIWINMFRTSIKEKSLNCWVDSLYMFKEMFFIHDQAYDWLWQNPLLVLEDQYLYVSY